MKIGIIGTGNVGSALGKGWASKGHHILFGTRQPESEKVQRLLAEVGEGGTAVSIPTAIQQASIIVLATPWNVLAQVTQSVTDWQGKFVIDATNPIAPGFQLAVGGDWWVAFYIFLAVLSLGLSLSSKTPLLKAGAGVHVANSIYLMAVLVKLFPESIKLSWTDVAPVISVMALLIGNVAVLLLWNELGKGFELKA